MNDFEQKLLRLKQLLGVSEDQGVAEALGVSKAALSDRKRRGSFPEDKLFALIARRPDLKIDPTYVLTGDRSAAPASAQPPPVMLNTAEPRPPPLSPAGAADREPPSLGECVALIETRAARLAIKLNAVGLATLGGLYWQHLQSFSLVEDQEMIRTLLDSYAVGRGQSPPRVGG